jgi:cell fate regulator YaaT (PSP1 superfamily)
VAPAQPPAPAGRRRPAAIRQTVLDLVARHGLNLRVVAIEAVDDDPEFGRLTRVFYTAPARVDFRALVVDLARALSCRIDLRQLGERDLAARLGGVGVCGQGLCCATWLAQPPPVPVTLTRGLPASHDTERLAGCCGRLMCCLRYEADPETAPAVPSGCPRAARKPLP